MLLIWTWLVIVGGTANCALTPAAASAENAASRIFVLAIGTPPSLAAPALSIEIVMRFGLDDTVPELEAADLDQASKASAPIVATTTPIQNNWREFRGFSFIGAV
ncbi:MAG: hypothetical protein JWM68_4346 [Verrucomicrobiales bacterium]|nr:hypothetical protein [Verrucomicrobiales bacterium]